MMNKKIDKWKYTANIAGVLSNLKSHLKRDGFNKVELATVLGAYASTLDYDTVCKLMEEEVDDDGY